MQAGILCGVISLGGETSKCLEPVDRRLIVGDEVVVGTTEML